MILLDLYGLINLRGMGHFPFRDILSFKIYDKNQPEFDPVTTLFPKQESIARISFGLIQELKSSSITIFTAIFFLLNKAF